MLGCKVQLFTVTRIGHAKEVGSTNVAKAFEAFDPNAISNCRSENMGFIGMIKMVACLVAQRRDNIRQSDIRWNPKERSLPKIVTTINKNHMQQDDA